MRGGCTRRRGRVVVGFSDRRRRGVAKGGGLFRSKPSGGEEDDEGGCSTDAYLAERLGIADGRYFDFRWMIQAVFVEGTVLDVVVAVGGGWWLFLFSISSSLAQRALNGLVSPRIGDQGCALVGPVV